LWAVSLCPILCLFDICLLIYFVGCHMYHIIILFPYCQPFFLASSSDGLFALLHLLSHERVQLWVLLFDRNLK
jgi:hypothetical protein